MTLLADVQKFLEDLVLGDFSENPSTISIVVNGAIGLIPVVDQILDVRDVAGVLVKSSIKGWNNLGENDYADIAFASIGCVPEFGSFFKGSVKPLWKSRKTAGRGVQGGVAMLERALGMGKGGVIKWVKAINWAQRTQDAVYQAQAALALYTQLLNTIAANPWWAPSDLVKLAKEMRPKVNAANSKLAEVIRKGSKLIENFLKDLLGEHAVVAQVALQVAQSTVKTSHRHSDAHVSGKASVTANQIRGHETPKKKTTTAKTDVTPKKSKTEKNELKETHPETGGNAQTKAKKETGLVSTTVEKTSKFISDMSKGPMGLVAEHMVDYHVLHELGGTKKHGSTQVQQHGALIKVNKPKRPVELVAEDLSLMFNSGIDSLWKKTDGKYLVVEAKGRIGAPSMKTTQAKSDSKKSKSKIPPLPPQGLGGKQAQLWRMLHDNGDKTNGSTEMQMSRTWIESDMKRILQVPISRSSYERRVYLVAQFPTAAGGVDDHLEAIKEATISGAIEPTHHQETHGISVEYSESDVATVEKLREKPKEKQVPSKNEKAGTSASSSRRKGK